MSKNIKRKNSANNTSQYNRHRNRILFGSFLILFSIGLTISFVSFFYSWEADQDAVETPFSVKKTENALSKIGNTFGYYIIFRGVGLSSFIFNYLAFILGLHFFLNIKIKPFLNRLKWSLYLMLWLSVLFTLFSDIPTIYGGVVGYEVSNFLEIYIGYTGIVLTLIAGVFFYLIMRLNATPEFIKPKVLNYLKKRKERRQSLSENNLGDNNLHDTSKDYDGDNNEETDVDSEAIIKKYLGEDALSTLNKEVDETEVEKEDDNNEIALEIEIEEPKEEILEKKVNKALENFGEYDPKLDLGAYQYPTLNLLKDYGKTTIDIDEKELEENKSKIVETLMHYKIVIEQIKATIGPTVTLYEIIPEKGIRISKIKNLEDDIALSLAALGIRIIAPMPGKGTVGIEVPNKKPAIVPMRTVIASQKFQQAKMDLPVAIGKTISNETFVFDMAKMPHLLMAGATGQGKSVGLNALLTSLLYKKHPAEIKFILVDPKKVELNLFSKIERHFLAKLPDSEEAIITDNAKVINTLNSLCIEMDNRYELLKIAGVRNIKEYNEKFKARKLNPENGHNFLPYIVLVIDEFADLIMTAGKEVELPIARLAQLARAIGIHLIVATQRPSANVITGIIKANFPARIAFRVASKIDSRTILDSSGADQLIGKGDMLFSQGNDLLRLQCAFVDTPEIEKINDFIGSQKGYPDAHLLPEYVGEESSNLDVDLSSRDALFNEAAEVVVSAQQGSTSLVQRKLKLGYNRAGRLIDQLEAAGIVGPFEGSKARQVLISDLESLKQLLKTLE